MQGFEITAESVARLGHTHVFGVMGSGNLPWLCHGVDKGLFEYVSVRHEAAAVNAAAGFARASGRVGLATTTQGPGIGNTYTALTAAVKDRAPIVLLTGIPAYANPLAPQRMDHKAFVQLTGAGFHLVEQGDKIASTIAQASHLAYARKCPQVVAVMNDLQERDVGTPDTPLASMHADDARIAPAASELERAVTLMAAARRPLILVGQGALYSGAGAAIKALGQEVGALFSHTMLAQHLLGRDVPVIGLVGVCAHPQTEAWLREADCVIAFGASLNGLQTKRQKSFEGKTVIQIEADPMGLPAFQRLDLALIGDARSTAQALLSTWRAAGLPRRSEWDIQAMQERIAAWRPHTDADDVSDDTGLDPRSVYTRLEQLLPPDRLIVTEGGRCTEVIHHLMSARDARSFLFASGFAAIGLGLGVALGAGLAQPDRPLLLVSGDGGFLMNAQELDTVVRSGRQMLVFVMNDAQYGSEARHLQHLARAGHPMTMAAAQWPYRPYVDVARAFGGAGEIISSKAELDRFELTPDKLQGLYLVDVRTKPDFDSWVEWSPKKLGLAAA